MTSTICGKSKVSCWNTLKNAERPMLGAFFSLGSSDTISEDVYMKLERFVCQLYIPSTRLYKKPRRGRMAAFQQETIRR